MTVDGFMYFHTAMLFGLRSATLTCQELPSRCLHAQPAKCSLYGDPKTMANQVTHALSQYTESVNKKSKRFILLISLMGPDMSGSCTKSMSRDVTMPTKIPLIRPFSNNSR